MQQLDLSILLQTNCIYYLLILLRFLFYTEFSNILNFNQPLQNLTPIS